MTTAHPGLDLARSAAMQLVLTAFQRAVATPGHVLITGEPHTGREWMARAIHQVSANAIGVLPELLFSVRDHDDRSNAPFVAVDCANGRDAEQRLFGLPAAPAEPSALERVGTESVIHRAHGGTLFLRAVQELPARAQVRLARVLRDGEVCTGTPEERAAIAAAKFRLVAASDTSCAEGDEDRLIPDFRRRLHPHRIDMPPLRRRKEDIPGLVRWLLADICGSLSIPTKSASRHAVALMSALPWRGNLRELRDLLRALALKVPGPLIRLADLLDNVHLDGRVVAFGGGGTLREARERFEREYVAAVLEQHHGRMAEAARALGLQRTNLYRKVKQLSVQRRRAGP